MITSTDLRVWSDYVLQETRARALTGAAEEAMLLTRAETVKARTALPWVLTWRLRCFRVNTGMS